MAGKKILTVCSANVNRSTTAAWLLNLLDNKNESWSRGSSQAACRIHGGTYCTKQDVEDADTILCMEARNKQELLNSFGISIQDKIQVLEIEDKYQAFSSNLIMEILMKLRT